MKEKAFDLYKQRRHTQRLVIAGVFISLFVLVTGFGFIFDGFNLVAGLFIAFLSIFYLVNTERFVMGGIFLSTTALLFLFFGLPSSMDYFCVYHPFALLYIWVHQKQEIFLPRASTLKKALPSQSHLTFSWKYCLAESILKFKGRKISFYLPFSLFLTFYYLYFWKTIYFPSFDLLFADIPTWKLYSLATLVLFLSILILDFFMSYFLYIFRYDFKNLLRYFFKLIPIS